MEIIKYIRQKLIDLKVLKDQIEKDIRIYEKMTEEIRQMRLRKYNEEVE